MGLPSIENFDISFIQRTAENLKNYNGEYEFTMLLNSLLGLVVVPNERKHRRDFTFDFWKMKITDFAELKYIFANKTVRLIKGNREIEQRKFYWLSAKNAEMNIADISILQLLKRVRHSIAHFGIIPLAKPEDRCEWGGIILQNFRKDGTLNFEICLMEDEIRTFSNFISSKYLGTYRKKIK